MNEDLTTFEFFDESDAVMKALDYGLQVKRDLVTRQLFAFAYGLRVALLAGKHTSQVRWVLAPREER